MSKTTIPEGLIGKELYQFLYTNKRLLVAEKKMAVKFSDPFVLTGGLVVNNKGEVVKAAADPLEESSSIQVPCVINTTNWMDSHQDVHLPGIWKKSLSELKLTYLLQEHSMTFKGIITDEVKAFTRKMTWRSLGLEIPGETEALIFDATIPKDRNTFMYNEYRMKRVKNHSVGMSYVDLVMCINDEDFKEEFTAWNKYIGQIANPDVAEDFGYFWAVKEAKVIEGSAVPIGSNIITPALENSPKSTAEITEPVETTSQEQPQFNLDEAIKSTKFFNY
jgi:hypothetical protein